MIGAKRGCGAVAGAETLARCKKIAANMLKMAKLARILLPPPAWTFIDPLRIVRGAPFRLDQPDTNSPLAQQTYRAAARCRGAPLVRLARRVLAGLIPLLFASVATTAHAVGLFLPVTAEDQLAIPAAGVGLDGETPRSVNGGAWERLVRIVRHELTTARDDVEFSGAGRLLLNVRDGVRLDVVVERTAPTKWGYSLSGRVASGDVGFVTLVVHDEAVAGTVWTPQSAYELHYLGGGVHALRDVTNAPPLECGGGLPSASSSADATGQERVENRATVDVLVVWTSDAEETYPDGKLQISSRVDMLVAYTNDAFERSGAFVSLNLVGAEQVEYSESNSGNSLSDGATDLNRLYAPDDGHMDRVHDRRNALGADLIYLLTRRGGGITNGVGFMVGDGSGRTFAHEVGHNFYVSHERGQAAVSVGKERISPGGWGYYQHGFTAKDGNTHFVTLMSYGSEAGTTTPSLAVPLYASPWRYGPDGSPLGVTRFSKERGNRGAAQAVLTINRNRQRVANYRPTRNLD